MTGNGDVTYNARRNLLGAIPLNKQITYHLWDVAYSGQKSNYDVKLLRKSKWHSQQKTGESNDKFISSLIYWRHSHLAGCITSLDFNPTGERAATINNLGICLISDLSTNYFRYQLRIFDREGNSKFYCILFYLFQQ